MYLVPIDQASTFATDACYFLVGGKRKPTSAKANIKVRVVSGERCISCSTQKDARGLLLRKLVARNLLPLSWQLAVDLKLPFVAVGVVSEHLSGRHTVKLAACMQVPTLDPKFSRE